MVRETIYQTLFDRIKVSTGVVTASRILKHWTDVPPVEQPALFQAQKGEDITIVKGQPKKYLLSAEIYLYVYGNDPAIPQSTILNALIDAVENSLAPSPGTDAQTLGLSNVSHCWIEGKIETDEGRLGQQSVAIIPVNILAY